MPKSSSLVAFATKSAESDPKATARLLETLSQDEAADIIKSLTLTSVDKVLDYANPVLSAALFEKLPTDLTSDLLKRMDAEKSMGLFLNLTEESRNKFIEKLDEKKKIEVRELLTYPEDSVGRLMTTSMLKIPRHIKVKDAVGKIRESAKKKQPPSYAYVVNEENQLCGVMTMRDALLADKDAFVETCMTPSTLALDPFIDSEQAALQLNSKRFFAAPVVDRENHLLGVIRADRLLKGVQEEVAQDIQQLFGVSKDETVFSTFGFSLRKRLPWLQVNLVTAFAAASVVALFEDIIAKITALAIFLPVVAGQGGNAGAQSLAVVMRGLVMREISPNKVKGVLIKETMLGAVNGLVTGVITAIVAWIWKGNPYLGLVIGLGMIVNLVIAGFSGAIIPLLMKKMGFDPAQCSNIILTTVTDVMGFLAFLGFAVLFQSFLI